VSTEGDAQGIEAQAARRRTFAIISHPDAGKTTLTEKLLLYGGAIAEAGAVKARAGRRSATSDWMAMEQERGISITSTVLQFTYRGCTLNLLDTPGHRDFSEDTFRVLTAADAAVMVLDSAKGIESQTLKLFEVCRSRHMPIFTFLNKFDRPGREPLELLDEIETALSLRPTPVTWPIGPAGDFLGVVDRRSGEFIRHRRIAHGAIEASEEVADLDSAAIDESIRQRGREELGLLDAVGADFDAASFLGGQSTPLFVGSAVTNFGVRHLLDAIVDLAPRPHARADATGTARPLAAPFSGQVFKIQANMDPAHRDHVAFVRICSGRFTRGDMVTVAASGRAFSTKHAMAVFGSDRATIDDAYPGDVVGLVNASELQIGDTLYNGARVDFPAIPTFSPELFARASARDTGRTKQFRRGLEQLEREGVVQVLRELNESPHPIVAAVGQMQLEVFAHRLATEFGAEVRLEHLPYKHARRTDETSAGQLARMGGVVVLRRSDGELVAAFESPYWLARVAADHPEWCLEHLAGDATMLMADIT
jgi:peptide chain release factor 3